MHVHQGIGHGLVQFFHALGHGAGVPVLQHAAGAEPERILGIRCFGGRLVGQGEDNRLLVGVAVELHGAACLNIRVQAFTVTPTGFLAVDHRPAQATFAVVTVERGKVMPVAATKLGVLFEQAFLRIETKGLGFIVLVAGFHLVDGELVDLTILEQHLEESLALELRGLGQ
ncbi:hypothetical protein D3C71_1687260 [compost metagenome]